VAILPALLWRLFDEEKFLARNLPGYPEYESRVRYRLIPRVWWNSSDCAGRARPEDVQVRFQAASKGALKTLPERLKDKPKLKKTAKEIGVQKGTPPRRG
jgi:hypothetical protein